MFDENFSQKKIAELDRNAPLETAGGVTKVAVSYHPGNVRSILGGKGLGFMHQEVGGQDCFVKAGTTTEGDKFLASGGKSLRLLARFGSLRSLSLFSQETLPLASKLSYLARRDSL